MPKISVIVPVYKVEQYLDRCVQSILTQSFSDFELILVDDGSPDRSGEMCDEYAAKDARVHVIHKENGGLSSARNAGIDWVYGSSDSEWLTFIDSDDWIHPEYLERLLSAAMIHNTNMSVGGFARISCEQLHDAKRVEDNGQLWDVEQFFVEKNTLAIIACAKLYRKECFRDVRYPVGKIHEDEYTTYKLLFQNPTVIVIDEPLYYYYVNPDSITENRDYTKYMDRVEAFEERVVFFKDSPFEKAYRLSVEMYVCKAYGALDTIETHYIKAPHDVKRLKSGIRMCIRHAKPRLDRGTSKRIKKEVWRYRKHFPNRILIKLLGQERYACLKKALKH